MGRNYKKLLLASAAVMLMIAQPAVAEIKSDLTLYLWGAGISGNATLGSKSIPAQPVDVDFDSILDKLDFGFQVHYEGTGEQWGGGLDITYMKLSDTNDAGVSAEAKLTLSELFGIYKASNAFDVLLGVRFTGVDVDLEGPGGLVGAEGDRSLTDGYVGGRVKLPLSEKWQFGLRGDIGAGSSDLVWNVLAAVNWQVARSVSLRGGYRWLDYELEKDDDPLEASLNMQLSGPFLGVAFQW